VPSPPGEKVRMRGDFELLMAIDVRNHPHLDPLPGYRERREEMINRYEQVALTYFRQWQFWAYLAAWAAAVVLADVVPPWFRQTLALVFLSIAAAGPAAVIGQAKFQIADARASLMPGFRTPHVVVAVALSLGAIVLMPLLT